MAVVSNQSQLPWYSVAQASYVINGYTVLQLSTSVAVRIMPWPN